MTVGVLGTMVWDRIEHPDGEAVERWGGISYSLAAAAAAVPDGWTIRPILKLGRDLAEPGHALLETIPGLERPGGVVEVDAPNNRVHLRYRDRHDRDEYLTGGVPGWGWDELAPYLDGLDGLYVNMISGFELDARTAEELRDRFHRPRYVDLHSVVLAVDEDGHRTPRRPDRPEAWLTAFHVVQANASELSILAGDEPAETTARSAVRDGARAVLVTRGPDGARWFAPADGPVWPAGDGEAAPTDGAATGVESGEVPMGPARTGDPTGCGDVWGATCFVELMQGRVLSQAMARSNRAAARNVDHRGADGLYGHLREDA